MSTGDERLLALIGKAYDAAVERESWESVLAGIAAEFRSPAANMMGDDFVTGTLKRVTATIGVSDEMTREYAEYYVARDVLTQAGTKIPVGAVGTDESLVPRDEYRRTEFFDYLVRHHLGHTMGGFLATDGTTATMFALQRPLKIGPYTQDEVRRMSLLLPHLERAWAVQVRIGTIAGVAADAEAALEQLPFGTIALDARGEVVRLSGLARDLVGRRDALQLSGGELRAGDLAETKRLRALIADACGIAAGKLTRGGGSMPLTRNDGSHVVASIAPIPGHALHGRAVAVMFVHDPRRAAVDPERTLRDVYGLTPAEARLAAALAGGDTLPDLADRLRVSHHTLRAQLKSVMRKTDTARQSELVALLLRGALESR